MHIITMVREIDFKELAHTVVGAGQVCNLQGRPAGWKFRQVLML